MDWIEQLFPDENWLDILIPSLLPFITAAFVTYFAIPPLITVAREKKLHDEPNYRKKHERTTPTLGGIAIFAGILISYTFWSKVEEFQFFKYTLIGIMLLFFVGIKDDIIGLNVVIKVVAQLLATLVIIVLADIRITNLNGLFGIEELNYFASLALTLVIILGITNSVNLIDGVDGLAAGIGFIVAALYGSWFFIMGFVANSILSFAICGALLAFLRFNFAPAKIFMGDTGALLVGFLLSILTIRFIEFNFFKERIFTPGDPLTIKTILSSGGVAFALLIIPIFDTIRVMFLRIIDLKSPFMADRRHIHYLLMDLGLSHRQICYALYGATIFFITMAYALQRIGTLYLILIILGICMATTFLLTRARRSKTPAPMPAEDTESREGVSG